MTRPFNPRLRIKSDTLAALAVALAPVLYFLPAVRGLIALCPDDGLLFNVPLRAAAARITLGGSLPLWDPYIFSGMPLFASAQGGLLFPLNWFYLAFPTVAATNLMVISTYAAAGLGAYLFARRTGSSVAGALVTALAWEFGGFTVAQLAHINIVQVAAMMPWTLWAVEVYCGGGGRRAGLLVSLLVALQAFVGHQQTLAYSLALVSAYAVVMALGDRRARGLYLKSLGLVAAGLLLAAVQILPTFELLRNSLRADASYEFFVSFSLPRRMVETFFAPYVFGGGDGRLFRAAYVGPPFYAEMAGYVGSLGLMLAAAAILLRRDARTKFWAVAALVCLTLALGGHAPLGIYKLIYRVPVLNLFRVPARHLLEAEFALAVLAGRGLTALAARRGERGTLRLAAIVGASVLLLTCLAVTVGRPGNFELGRAAPLGFMRAPELFLPVFVAALSAWALFNFARARRRGAAALLVCVLALDLALWGQSSGWRVGSPAADDELWRVPETVKLLRAHAPPDTSSYRILTAPHTFDPAVAPVPPSVSHSQDWVVWTQPDVYMAQGIQNAAGYDGFGLARYSRLAGDMKVWGELTDPDSTLRGDSCALDILNVRYLLSMRKQPDKTGATRPGNAPQPTPELKPATTKLGGALFADGDLGLPNVGAGKRITFSVAPVEADRVSLLTNLSWSDAVPDGTEVARVRVRSRDGRTFEFPLRAGVDTSEWAYDRPDIRAHVRHSRANVGTSYAVADAQAQYAGHTYVATFSLPERVAVAGGEIVAEPSEKWPELLLGVFRVSLAEGDRAYALGREQFSVEKVEAGGQDSQKASGGETQAADDARGGRWRLLAQTQYVDIYENAHALPRAWLATQARALGEQTTLEAINTGRLPDGSRWEPRATALLESETPTPLAGGAQGSAEITRYEANRVDLRTSAPSPSVLVLSENHYPGWRAYVDGRPAGVLRVDYNLRGVLLDAGAHNVSFVYRPKSALIGLLVSLLTAALLGLWAWRVLPEERAARTLARVIRAGRKPEAAVREEV
ncbi:MAG TPA: YfhO family protein [Pyrinomonadaceae bacterium]|nr:YfhO family protein [Pyrinomonadaceae bacterium]